MAEAGKIPFLRRNKLKLSDQTYSDLDSPVCIFETACVGNK